MSIKQIWICQCDLCDCKVDAKTIWECNEIVASLPNDWTTGYNSNFHLCHDCTKTVKA